MRETNRGKAWSFLAGMPDLYKNISEAVRWLKSEGIGYHAQTMWRDVSTAFQSARLKPLQQVFAATEYLPQKLFIDRQWRRPEGYYYYGNAYFRDPVTDDLYFRSYSVYADTSLTDQELSEIIYGKEDEKEEGTEGPAKFAYFESLERYHKWGAPRSEGYGIAEI